MSAFRRHMLEEEFVELAARAIGLGHPNADWLVAHGYVGNTSLTVAALEAANERLAKWLSEREPATTGQG